MSEWWTYRPGDFLMFSPRIYWRLFEDINQTWWPGWGLLTALVGAVLWWCSRQPASPRPVQAMAWLLAAAWGVVAWAFVWQRFAPIQWLAAGIAVAFGVQAMLWVLTAAQPAGTQADPVRRRAGLALGAWALMVHPMLAWAQGRPWQQAELFGLAPDPTALATLAWLLLTTRGASPAACGWRVALWPLPLAWCLFSAATLFTMGSLQGLVPLVGSGAALAAAYWGRRMRKR